MSRKRIAAFLTAGCLIGTMASSASAVVNIVDNSAALGTDGVAGDTEFRYVVSGPGTLSRDDTADLATRVLSNTTETGGGDATSPGGNVELGVADTVSQEADWTTNTLPVVNLFGQLGGATINLRSVTAEDWFGADLTTAFGDGDLANQWFNDLLAHYGLDGTTTAAQQELVFNAFAAESGFFRLSDPNVSYVYRDSDLDSVGGSVYVGLAGTVGGVGSDSPSFSAIASDAVNAYFDGLVAEVNAQLATQIALINANGALTALQKTALIAQAQAAAALAIGQINTERAATLALIPAELVASEVVIADYNSLGEQVLYGFVYTASGLATDDNTRSYDANFEVSFDVPGIDDGEPPIPEPMTAGLMGLALASLALGRRRR